VALAETTRAGVEDELREALLTGRLVGYGYRTWLAGV
jgi:hypothetical protein